MYFLYLGLIEVITDGVVDQMQDTYDSCTEYWVEFILKTECDEVETRLGQSEICNRVVCLCHEDATTNEHSDNNDDI